MFTFNLLTGSGSELSESVSKILSRSFILGFRSSSLVRLTGRPPTVPGVSGDKSVKNNC